MSACSLCKIRSHTFTFISPFTTRWTFWPFTSTRISNVTLIAMERSILICITCHQHVYSVLWFLHTVLSLVRAHFTPIRDLSPLDKRQTRSIGRLLRQIVSQTRLHLRWSARKYKWRVFLEYPPALQLPACMQHRVSHCARKAFSARAQHLRYRQVALSKSTLRRSKTCILRLILMLLLSLLGIQRRDVLRGICIRSSKPSTYIIHELKKLTIVNPRSAFLGIRRSWGSVENYLLTNKTIHVLLTRLNPTYGHGCKTPLHW